jgi:transcriptional regulator with XRE-family HTH domain
MPRGKRYTPAQKEQMRKKALDMQAKGMTQKDIADKLGVAVATLSKLIQGTDGSRRRGRRGTAVSGLSASNPVLQLAQKQERLNAIDQEIAGLEQEKQDLQESMKSLYDQVGKDIFKK